MCNPQPKTDRCFEVSAVWRNSIAYHNKQIAAGVVKAFNCVMLSQMDFKSDIPSMDQLKQWAEGWEEDIRMMLAAPKNQYDVDKVTDNTKTSCVYIPMRLKERWVLVTCDMGKHKCG